MAEVDDAIINKLAADSALMDMISTNPNGNKSIGSGVLHRDTKPPYIYIRDLGEDAHYTLDNNASDFEAHYDVIAVAQTEADKTASEQTTAILKRVKQLLHNSELTIEGRATLMITYLRRNPSDTEVINDTETYYRDSHLYEIVSSPA